MVLKEAFQLGAAMQHLCYTPAVFLRDNDEVVIRCVTSPYKFFVHRVEDARKYAVLMNEMINYYERNSRVAKAIFKGMACVVEIAQIYYRAEILDIDEGLQIAKVELVDFGQMVQIAKKQILEIRVSYLDLPKQAVPCALKGFETRSAESNDVSSASIMQLFAMVGYTLRKFKVLTCSILEDRRNVVHLISENIKMSVDVANLTLPASKHYNKIKRFDLERITMHLEPRYRSIGRTILKTPSTETVHISVWNSPHEFSVQLDKAADSVAKLTSEMCLYYQDKPSDCSLLDRGAYAVIKNPDDGLFYRCSILGVNPKTHQSWWVEQVDNGWRHYVKSDALWPLAPQFSHFPRASHRCTLGDFMIIGDATEIFDRANRRSGSEPLRCYFQEINNSKYLVDLITPRGSLKEELIKDGLIIPFSHDAESVTTKRLGKQQFNPSFRSDSVFESPNNNVERQLANDTSPSHSTLESPKNIHNNVASNTSPSDAILLQSPSYKPKESIVYNPHSETIKVSQFNSLEKIEKSVKEKLINKDNTKKLQIDVNETYYCSHFVNPEEFYIQCENQDLNDLTEYLAVSGNALPKVNEFEQDKIVAALYEEDGNYYRGKMLKELPEQGYVYVHFIDYGNSSVTKDCRKLPPKYASLPFFAIKCGIELSPDCINISSDDLNLQLSNVLTEGFNISSWKQLEDSVILKNVSVNGTELNERLKGSSKEEIKNSEPLTGEGKAKCVEIDVNKTYYCSHFANPKEFYIQCEDQDFNSLTEYLATSNEQPKVNKFEKDKIVAALYEDDGNYYRAKMLKDLSEEGCFYVQFVDYGNSSPTRDCREIPLEYVSLPWFAIKCCLQLSPDCTNRFCEDEIEAMLEKHLVAEFKVKPINQLEDSAVVEILIDGVSINEILEKAGSESTPNALHEDVGGGEPSAIIDGVDNIEFNPEIKYFVSHYVSPDEFYIKCSDKDFDILQEFCTFKARELPKMTNFEKDKIVVAVFEEEGIWCRAKLLKSLPEQGGYEVFWVDYGNVSVTHDCREIPSKYAEMPYFAKKCCVKLDKDNCNGLVDVLSCKFYDDVSSVDDFNVIFREYVGDCALISIIIDGSDITNWYDQEVIEKSPEKGTATEEEVDFDFTKDYCVTYFSDTLDFYVSCEDSRLDEIQEFLAVNATKLPAIDKFEFNKIVAARFEDDGLLYRAKLLKELPDDGGFEVFFVDFGNVHTTNDCKEIPEEWASLPFFAKKCCVETLDDTRKLSDNAREKYTKILSDPAFTFKIDLQEQLIDRALIRLSVD